jgi:hypothetical protein
MGKPANRRVSGEESAGRGIRNSLASPFDGLGNELLPEKLKLGSLFEFKIGVWVEGAAKDWARAGLADSNPNSKPTKTNRRRWPGRMLHLRLKINDAQIIDAREFESQCFVESCFILSDAVVRCFVL